MGTINKTLVNRKEFYRLWFEFYKISLLSSSPEIKKRVDKSISTYYSWGDVKNSKFDIWWKQHDRLFKEDSVDVLTKNSDIDFDNYVVLQIPMNQSVSDLLNAIRPVLTDAHRKRINHRKNKNKVSSGFGITVGSEPKLKTLSQILNVYRDVYLMNPRVKGRKLLELVHQYYKSKPKSNRIPNSLNDFGSTSKSEKQRVGRNLRRWIEWGKQIQLNVLNGEFPGKY